MCRHIDVLLIGPSKLEALSLTVVSVLSAQWFDCGGRTRESIIYIWSCSAQRPCVRADLSGRPSTLHSLRWTPA